MTTVIVVCSIIGALWLLGALWAEKEAREKLSKILEAKKYDFSLKEKIVEDTLNATKVFSDIYAKYAYDKVERYEHYLRSKPIPAARAADTVGVIKKTLSEEVYRRKAAEYKNLYYESMLPELKESEDEQEEIVVNVDYDKTEVGYWLSKDEYQKLSDLEKCQRALDNYVKKNKSKMEIGKDYERYIGYLSEKEGYKCEYQGIIKGYEDLGRDLICRKDNKVLIVQCKCWSSQKTIHEKHINQLYGTYIAYKIENGISIDDDNVKAYFITSTVLSETAKRFAGFLGVKYAENRKLEEYPRIKCNIRAPLKIHNPTDFVML